MDMMLEQGLAACVGKAERGPAATDSIAKHKSAYLMAVGGAAYLVARAIKGAKVVGSEDLGMEAIYRSEEHTPELQSLMRIQYAVLCLKNKTPHCPCLTYSKANTTHNK